jgi:hypothetical protein
MRHGKLLTGPNTKDPRGLVPLKRAKDQPSTARPTAKVCGTCREETRNVAGQAHNEIEKPFNLWVALTRSCTVIFYTNQSRTI